MDTFIQDIRFGFRMLMKNRGFTAIAVLVLALGIGANTAIFSFVNAVLLQKMPFKDSDHLVMVWEASPRGEDGRNLHNVVNPWNFLEWKKRNHSFENIAALITWPLSLSGEGEPIQVESLIVSDGFFQILGVQPILGRWFTPKEDTPGNDNVVMLSEGLWRSRYGADPNIIGKVIRVSNRPTTIVGVMPASFRFPLTSAKIWVPLATDPAQAGKTGRFLSTIARLRKDVTIPSAQADMTLVAKQLEHERYDKNAGWSATVVDFKQQITGDVRKPLLILLGSVVLVLLIACANVTNLMLMRLAGRSREIAVRAALGASAKRIIRQLVIESSLLSLLAGIFGLLIGIWTVGVLKLLLPDTGAFMQLKDVHIDVIVFLFALGLSFVTGFVFGIPIAYKTAHTGLQQSLKKGALSLAGNTNVWRNVLVISEIALSIVLLVGAGLLLHSFARLTAVDPGFDATHVLTMQLNTDGKFDTNEKLAHFSTRVMEEVRTVPGVEAAGSAHFLPLGKGISVTSFYRSDRAVPAPGTEPGTQVLVIMPGYFSAMNIPLLRGRVFDDRDTATSIATVVINQTLAKQFYGDENPIGKQLTISWSHPDVPYQIIGIVGNSHQKAIDEAPYPTVFISNIQEPTGPLNLVIRTHQNPQAIMNTLIAKIHSIDHDVPVSEIRTMNEYVASSISTPKFHTTLLGAFAAIALILSAVGIFGVISYSVVQSIKELAIRRALGADTWSVVKLVLQRGMILTAIGVGIGLAAAAALNGVLRSLLYEVSPTDPITFLGVAVGLSVIALIASYIPARRASRINPLVALRYE